jgi:NAD(P)-dependent dehydrogenase (short-subunit alcohol dehydrogenase family)
MRDQDPNSWRSNDRKLVIDGEEAKNVRWIFARFLEIGRPEEVAAAVLFLAGAGATFFTDQCLGANGGAAMA